MEFNVGDFCKDVGDEEFESFIWNFFQKFLGNYKIGFLERFIESEKMIKQFQLEIIYLNIIF